MYKKILMLSLFLFLFLVSCNDTIQYAAKQPQRLTQQQTQQLKKAYKVYVDWLSSAKIKY